MAKVKQKLSGFLRTFTRVCHFCAIRSYLPTAKHVLDFFATSSCSPRASPRCPPLARQTTQIDPEYLTSYYLTSRPTASVIHSVGACRYAYS